MSAEAQAKLEFAFLESDDFQIQAKIAIENAASVLTQGKQTFSLRCIETTDELQSVCASLAAESSCVVLLQSYEHKLRSYKPFQCWLLLSVVTSESVCTSYLVDCQRLRQSLSDLA